MSNGDTRRGRLRAELCTAPASKQFPPSLRVVVVVGVVDTVDKWFRRRSDPVFYPPRLWAEGVDNQGVLWTAESSPHPVHRAPVVLPRLVPRNTQVLPRPTHRLGVTAFTLPGDRPCFVAEQWTNMWRSASQLCTTGPLLWASGGQLSAAAVRRPRCPQSVDTSCPQIHTRLSRPYAPWRRLPVDRIGTTPLSPGCGNDNRRDPVEKRIAATANRTGAAGVQLLMRLVNSVTWL